MKKMKKWFASLLVLCMVICMPNMIGLAEEEDPLGSMNNPIPWSWSAMGSSGETIPGETTTYYTTRFGGTAMTITADHDFVVGFSKFEQYSSENGSVTIEIPANESTFSQTMFFIYNEGAEMTASVKFVPIVNDPVGSENNPAKHQEGRYSGSTAEITAGSEGYHYIYTATEDGLVNFSITATDDNWDNLPWEMSIIKKCSENGEYVYPDRIESNATNDPGEQEIEVKKDDELYIYVNTRSTDNNINNNPAGYIDTVLILSPVGDQKYPEKIEEAGPQLVELQWAYSAGYYFTFTAPEDGKLNLSFDSAKDAEENNIGWQYYISDATSVETPTTHYSNDTDVVSPYEFKKGDVLKIWVNTFEPSDSSEPAGTIQMNFNITYREGSVLNPIKWDTAELSSTQTIVAGENYYSVGIADMLMGIVANGEYTLVIGGKEYPSEKGVVNVKLPKYEIMGSKPTTTFSIKNSGEALEAEVVFTYEEGHKDNPKKVEAGKYEHTFKKGDADFYYEWTAPADGIVTVGISSELLWGYSVSNSTTNVSGVVHWGDDSVVVPSEMLTVSKGDVLHIKVTTLDLEDYDKAAGTVSTKVSFETAAIVDNDTITSVKNEIANATEGSTKPIEIPAYNEETGKVTATVIPTDILAAVKDKDIWVSMDMNSYEWLINGKDITDTNPINLQVNIGTSDIAEDAIKNVANGNTTVTFSIEHDGDFGFKASLVTVIDTAYAGKTANLYWDNNGTLVKVGTCVIDANGAVKFDFTHASDYVVVVEGTAETNPGTNPGTDPGTNPGTNPGVPNTGDISNTLVYVVVLMGAALVAAGFVAKKKFA